jgi:hypothetical protein
VTGPWKNTVAANENWGCAVLTPSCLSWFSLFVSNNLPAAFHFECEAWPSSPYSWV